MAAHKEVEVILLQKFPCDIWSKGHSHASFAGCPPRKWGRVTPQKLTHQALVRWFFESVNSADVFQRDIILTVEVQSKESYTSSVSYGVEEPYEGI